MERVGMGANGRGGTGDLIGGGNGGFYPAVMRIQDGLMALMAMTRERFFGELKEGDNALTRGSHR